MIFRRTPPPEPTPEDLTDHDLLIRIDERTQQLAREFAAWRPRLRAVEIRTIVLSVLLGMGGGGIADKFLNS